MQVKKIFSMNLNSVVSTYKNRPYTLDPRPLESLGTFF